MKNIMVINVEKLCEEPYLSVLCYPRSGEEEFKGRLKELQELGVNAVEFSGAKQAYNIPVLGKGCVGIVVIAHVNSERVALKIRRVDADRTRMQHEAEMLRTANSVNVGPKLLDVSKNFLLMQFIEGTLFPDWLGKLEGKIHLTMVLRKVLEQCWRLDKIGLDHGELSYASKHVIVNEKDEPVIVDFETASVNRKPSNVTSICQFMFVGGAVAEKVNEKLGKNLKKALIEALRKYKNDRTRENFESIAEVCSL